LGMRYLDMIAYDDEFAKKSVENHKPFYDKIK
ncbi:MAG: enhanced serine sensitivity protein SseB, partial [Fusobacterium periodonticum]|nr:enhanced serine sensitivity protein SseB [Fusobacterium periodonticum]